MTPKGRGIKSRKLPQRQCVGCQARKPKRELVRIVRTPEGSVEVDPTGKRSGRGAYICPSPECLEMAVRKGRLASALESPIPMETLEELRRSVDALREGRECASRDLS